MVPSRPGMLVGVDAGERGITLEMCGQRRDQESGATALSPVLLTTS